ncbi:MAG: ATP-binding cassette domain-containing protein [Stackebrandtia sp.]
MNVAIQVAGLVKKYGDLTAVRDVSFDVASGEFFGILGPNGAGKTTTLELIEGLREPDAGTVSLLGASPWPRNRELAVRIGVQLQATAFFARLTAREQLRTFAELYGVSKKRADEMLEVVGLTDKASTRIEKLSGGQAQRLSIACALVNDPEVVFLDEPTAALDPQARRNLWDLLRQLNTDGRTVVLTTHYMDEAESLCERVAIMDNGEILTINSPAALVRDLNAATHISISSGHLSAEQATSVAAGAAEIDDDGIDLTFTTHRPAGVLTALAEREALDGLRVRGATLEDVFLNLTGREYRA